jgi:hypothetical protein
VPGLLVYPSQGNFVLVKLPQEVEGPQLRDHLLQNHGLVIRECGNKLGITNQFCRLVVRPQEDSAMLVQAMHEYFWSRGAGEALSREPAREVYEREAQRREEVAYAAAEPAPPAAVAEAAPARRPRGFSRQSLQEAVPTGLTGPTGVAEEPPPRRYLAAASEDSPPRGFSRQSLREAVGGGPAEEEREDVAAGGEAAPKPWYLQGRESEERRGLRVRPLRVANDR